MKLQMLTLAMACVGCVHAPITSPPEHEERVLAEAKPKEVARPPVVAKPAPKPEPQPSTSGTSAKPEAERPAVAPGRPQLATSAEGLMLPGAVLMIQQALIKKGYHKVTETGELDDETTASLRHFQADQKIMRTGSPDRETLRRLGISADKIFRK